MDTSVKTVKTREVGKRVNCPSCRAVHVIRKTGKYRCTKCSELFRAVMEPTSSRPSFAAAIERPIELLAPEPKRRVEEPATSARCARHPETTAYESCARCGDFTCPACIKRTSRGVRCLGCAERKARPAAQDDVTPGVGPGVSDILGAALASFPAMLPRGLPLALFPTAASAGGLFAFMALSSSGSLAVVGVGTLVLCVSLYLVHLLTQIGLLGLARRALASAPEPSLGESFAVGVAPVARLAWTQFLQAAVLVGLVAGVYGGGFLVGMLFNSLIAGLLAGAVMLVALVVFSIRIALVVPVVVYENLSGIAAFKRSFTLVGSSIGTVLVAAWVMGIPLGVLMAAGSLAHASLGGLAGLAVGAAFSAAGSVLLHGFLASLYWSLRARGRR